MKHQYISGMLCSLSSFLHLCLPLNYFILHNFVHLCDVSLSTYQYLPFTGLRYIIEKGLKSSGHFGQVPSLIRQLKVPINYGKSVD